MEIRFQKKKQWGASEQEVKVPLPSTGDKDRVCKSTESWNFDRRHTSRTFLSLNPAPSGNAAAGPAREPGGRLPELGHSCSALAISVFAMFFSPARYSSLTDSSLRNGAHRDGRAPTRAASGQAQLQFRSSRDAPGLGLPARPGGALPPEKQGTGAPPPHEGPRRPPPQPRPGSPTSHRREETCAGRGSGRHAVVAGMGSTTSAVSRTCPSFWGLLWEPPGPSPDIMSPTQALSVSTAEGHPRLTSCWLLEASSTPPLCCGVCLPGCIQPAPPSLAPGSPGHLLPEHPTLHRPV